ncbi:MAG: tripartite tricarboxylate transporter substrate binding protein [Thermoanaerobacteraceae bacterium]|nr:tripartite tricarboxylate transporter substrate binding protein [Thermoanaerobacteraceae bacterium]
MGKKSLLIVILILVLAFISACGGQGQTTQQTGGQQTETQGKVDAQYANYPDHPIQLIVPWGAGGDSDVLNRLVAKYLEKYLGQPIVIVNIGGGGGSVGAQQAMQAKPDGYTLLAGHDSLGMSYLTGGADFNYFDFEPIALMMSTADIVATHPGNSWSGMKDVIEDAKKRPEEITFGCSLGSTSQLTPAGIEYATGVKFKYVGYKDTAERMTALLGKQIDLGSTSIPAGSEYMKAGKIKLLGIAADKRAEQLPDLPTLKEQGIDWSLQTNRGYFAPKGTPKEVIQKVADALRKVSEDPDFQKEMYNQGTFVNYKNPEEYTQFLKENYEMLKDVLSKTGLLKR